MINQTFSDGNSIIHTLDPRLKLIFAFFFSFAVGFSYNFTALIFALFVSLLSCMLARLKLIAVLQRITVVNIFNIVLIIVLPLTYTGGNSSYLLAYSIDAPGMQFALQIILKSNAIVLAFICFISTISISTLGYSMSKLKIHNKLVHLFLITYRYIFVIESEFYRLKSTMRLRCFSPGTNMHTYKTLAYLLGMLLVRASTRAERVQQAMICRGFDGKFISLYQFSFCKRDYIGCILMILALVVLITIQY